MTGLNKPNENGRLYAPKPPCIAYLRHSARGYILLELIISLVLLGFLMPILAQIYHVAHGFLQTTTRQSSALQERHYLHFVLREDMQKALSVSQIGDDYLIHTSVGTITYTLEAEVLKRRFLGQTIRLNPDLSVRCLAITMTPEILKLQVETDLGTLVLRR